MLFQYEVIHKNLEGSYNLIYTDTDSLVYHIRHHDMFEWISQNRVHFDLSDSNRPDLQDNTNKKVVGKFKRQDRKRSSLRYDWVNREDGTQAPGYLHWWRDRYKEQRLIPEVFHRQQNHNSLQQRAPSLRWAFHRYLQIHVGLMHQARTAVDWFEIPYITYL